MRKIDLIIENIRDEYMINLLEEGEVSELEALKTKKFLNESLGRIRGMLVEEGALDAVKQHLANNWGKYLAGAGALGGATAAHLTGLDQQALEWIQSKMGGNEALNDDNYAEDLERPSLGDEQRIAASNAANAQIGAEEETPGELAPRELTPAEKAYLAKLGISPLNDDNYTEDLERPSLGDAERIAASNNANAKIGMTLGDRLAAQKEQLQQLIAENPGKAAALAAGLTGTGIGYTAGRRK